MASIEQRYDQATAGSQSGAWRSIEKDTPTRKPEVESDVLVPMLQTLTGGLLVSAPVVLIVVIVTMSVKAGFLAGVVVFSAVVAYSWWGALAWVRESIYATERYSTETQQATEATASTIRVEVIEHPTAHSVRTVYDVLDVDEETLATALSLEVVSRRALASAGVPEQVAARLVRQLEAGGFIARERRNAPASWTAKGAALRRSLPLPSHQDQPDGIA